MKHRTKLNMNEKGSVSIETLTILVVLVLIAAVAASVLLNTSGGLQEKAQATSSDAKSKMTGIEIDEILGDRGMGLNSSFDDLKIRVKPGPGTTSVDLRQVTLDVKDSSTRSMLAYDTGYSAIAVIDSDISFNTSQPILNSGDLIEISVNSSSLGFPLPPGKNFKVDIKPTQGRTLNLEITTPYSYGVDRYVHIYP